MLNIIKDNLGARKKSKLLGRGIASGKGKTSGRGGKGQTARSGVAINGFEGGQTSLLRRLPKRGFKSRNKTVYQPVSLAVVSEYVKAKKLPSDIKVSDLKTCGLVNGISTKIKLLGKDEVSAKFSIEAHAASKSASDMLEKNGNKLTIVK